MHKILIMTFGVHETLNIRFVINFLFLYKLKKRMCSHFYYKHIWKITSPFTTTKKYLYLEISIGGCSLFLVV